jgi:hypothetical protein
VVRPRRGSGLRTAPTLAAKALPSSDEQVTPRRAVAPASDHAAINAGANYRLVAAGMLIVAAVATVSRWTTRRWSDGRGLATSGA